jgi:hypothetical protein
VARNSRFDVDSIMRVASILLALALPLMSIGQGPVRDDARHLLLLRSNDAGAVDLFHIGDRAEPRSGSPDVDGGERHGWSDLVPWWADPEYRLVFFRPVTNLLAQLDVVLFGAAFALYKIQALLFMLVGQICFLRLAERFTSRRVASIAGLLFAVHAGHLLGEVWWGARHVLVAGVLVLCAFYLHVRATESGRARHRVGSLALLTLAFLSSESAVAGLALFVAYEWFRAAPSLRHRIASVAPALLLAVAVQLWARHLGCGAFGSGLYVDPVGAPLAWLEIAPGRWVLLAAALLHGAPADLTSISPHPTLQLAAGLGVLGAFLVAALVLGRRLRDPERRAAAFWLVAAGLSLLPMTVAQLTNRVLYIPSIATSIALAMLIGAAWRGGIGRRAIGVALATTQVVVAVAWWGVGLSLLGGHERQMRLRGEALAGQDLAGVRHVLFWRGNPATRIVPLFAMVHHQVSMPPWEVVTIAPGRISIRRVDATTLEVRTLDADLFESPYERLYFRDTPTRSVSRPPFAFEWRPDDPRAITLRVSDPYELAHIRFFDDAPAGLRAAPPPAPGATLVLTAKGTPPSKAEPRP